METTIIYKYLAPGMFPGNETTITTATQDLASNEVLATLHPVSDIVSLQSDDPEEYGEGSKDYVVLDRHPFITQWGGSGYTASTLIVIVSDPDA